PVRPGDPRLPPEEVDALAAQPLDLTPIGVVRDLEVAPGECVHSIELARHRLACARDVARVGDRLAGAEQGLRGYAGPVGALPSDQLALGDRDLQAGLCQPASAVLTRRARAHHDHVVVEAHASDPCSARSRSMWARASSSAWSGVRPCSRATMYAA